MKGNIVLVHGYRGSPAGLAEIGERLEKAGYKVFLPSIPPFGGSGPLESYTRDSYADFIARYLGENKISKPVLVGHSMGSLIVAATAEKYPELLDNKLIFLAPISVKPPRPIAILNPLATAFPRGVVDVTTTAFNMVPNGLETTKKTMRLTREASKQFTSKSDVKLAGIFSIDHAISDFNFNKNTLFLAGAKDHLISRKKTEALAAELSKKMPTKTAFVSGTGHLLNYEKPLETAAEITKFLESDII
ncbi:alpha/beta hydrolase [Candidatus Saccharibacteria bacterium]|nr:alpha/beta hydrolase [Candidatus Saccharibacteria bacterium]